MASFCLDGNRLTFRVPLHACCVSLMTAHSVPQLGRRVFWWQQGSYVLSLLRSIVLMRLILPVDFGVFTLATTFCAYVTSLRAFDFRAPVIASKELQPRLLSTQFTSEFVVSLLNLVIFAALCPLLHGRYGGMTVVGVLVLVIVNGLDAAYSTPIYLSERNLEFPFLTKWRTFVNGISFGVCIVIALLGAGLWALLVDRLINSLFLGVILWRHTEWKLEWTWDRESFSYFVRFAGPLVGAGLLGNIIFGFDVIMLGTYWSVEDLGHYSRAMNWALRPMEMGSGFLGMMGLAIYSASVRNETQSTQKTYEVMTASISRITMWMTGMMGLMFKSVVPWLFGAKWEPMVPFFWALTLYAAARPLFQNAAQCITSLHEQKYFLYTVVAIAPIYALTVMGCVGHSPLWVGLAAGGVLAVGYALLERRIALRLGKSSWTIVLSPLGMLTLVGGCVAGMEYLQLNPTMYFFISAGIGFLYTGAAFWEWKTQERRVRSSMDPAI